MTSKGYDTLKQVYKLFGLPKPEDLRAISGEPKGQPATDRLVEYMKGDSYAVDVDKASRVPHGRGRR